MFQCREKELAPDEEEENIGYKNTAKKGNAQP